MYSYFCYSPTSSPSLTGQLTKILTSYIHTVLSLLISSSSSSRSSLSGSSFPDRRAENKNLRYNFLRDILSICLKTFAIVALSYVPWICVTVLYCHHPVSSMIVIRLEVYLRVRLCGGECACSMHASTLP